MFCDITNSLKTNTSPIFNMQKCDMETWSLQGTYTGNGLYSEVGNTYCAAVQLIFINIYSITYRTKIQMFWSKQALSIQLKPTGFENFFCWGQKNKCEEVRLNISHCDVYMNMEPLMWSSKTFDHFFLTLTNQYTQITAESLAGCMQYKHGQLTLAVWFSLTLWQCQG